ncbi:MAG TPA: hypothetical protein VIK85_02790 [Coriobacteriia bacterium]
MIATVSLNDPIRLAIVALGILIWAFAGFVAFNSLQRRNTDYAGVFEGRWFYAVPQAAFVVAFIVWQIPLISERLPWMHNFYVVLPVILAQQMGYLLRVVFPTSKRLEKRLDAECAAIRHSEAEEATRPTQAPAPLDDSFFDPDDPDA